MATTNYDEFADIAEDLLKEFGEEATFRKVRDDEDEEDGVPTDSETPWIPAGPVVTDIPKIRMVFLADDRDNRETKNFSRRSSVTKGNTLCYMGRESFAPTLKDLIYRDSSGRVYSIETISEYKPSDQDGVLYVMRLQ